jgi:hypothetical protein
MRNAAGGAHSADVTVIASVGLPWRLSGIGDGVDGGPVMRQGLAAAPLCAVPWKEKEKRCADGSSCH